MALMTGRDYIESLRKLQLEVYFMGEKITSVVDEPMFQPHINTAAIGARPSTPGDNDCDFPSYRGKN